MTSYNRSLPSHANGTGCSMNAEEGAALEEMQMACLGEMTPREARRTKSQQFQAVVAHAAQSSSNSPLQSKSY